MKVIKVFGLAMVILTSVLLANFAEARWWIFGAQEERPEILDAFVADVNVTDLKEILVLNKSSLKFGQVEVKGFALPTIKAPIGAALISLDEGKSWNKAELAADRHSFLYKFKPEPTEEYELQFKVIDTTGKNSDIQDIGTVRVRYEDVDIKTMIQEVFRELIERYEIEDYVGFMQMVSTDFRGDEMLLEDALENDFTAYNEINLDVIIDRVLQKGSEINVTFHYNLTMIDNKGNLVSKEGSSVYTFKLEGENYKLLAMASPIIFGVSRGEEIASGEAGPEAGPPPAPELPEGTAHLVLDGDGFDFSTGNYASWGAEADICYTSCFGGKDFEAWSCLWDLGPASLDSITEIDISIPGQGHLTPYVGYCYGIKTGEENYAKIEITDKGSDYVDFDWVYQPDGSNKF